MADTKIIIKPKMLLILEDNAGMRYWLKRSIVTSSLTKELFEIVEASTLSKAIHLFQELTFDGAIIDLDLPDSRGVNTLKEIKKVSQGAAIIVSTKRYDNRGDPSRDSDWDMDKFYRRFGADEVLYKPFNDKTFIHQLLFTIEQKKLKIEYHDAWHALSCAHRTLKDFSKLVQEASK